MHRLYSYKIILVFSRLPFHFKIISSFQVYIIIFANLHIFKTTFAFFSVIKDWLTSLEEEMDQLIVF